jgi:2-(1,2-epoxy-1,2-dihydrophenyl)acetyl-CoA isomerase
MAGLIEQTRTGGVLVLTFDRAERLNALPDLGDGDEVATCRCVASS